MNRGKIRKILAVAGISIFLSVLAYGTWAAQVPRITAEELKAMLGNPDLIIVDVRVAPQWQESKLKIQGAVREDPQKDPKSWAEKYSKDKTLVLYCS
jgi:rhodanese-related sulfurtransferase